MQLNGGKEISLMIDSGASVSIIKESPELYPLTKSQVNLLSVTGSHIKVRGETVVQLQRGEFTHKLRVIVVDKSTPFRNCGLLGADFLIQTAAILNIKTQMLQVADQEIPLEQKRQALVISTHCGMHNRWCLISLNLSMRVNYFLLKTLLWPLGHSK